MAEETDQVVDLEAFHQELLNSANNVRRMVVSWLPQSNELERFKQYDDANVNLDSLRTRPDRLGLGATPSSSKTSAAALANPNSAEGRIIRTLLGGTQKRKAAEEPETPRTSSSGSQSNGKLLPARTAAAADDSEEEDSRSKAFSSKGKKKADFFHDKPSKPSQGNTATEGQISSKKNKKRKQLADSQAADNEDAGAEESFVKPGSTKALKKETPSAPASPTRPQSNMQQEKADASVEEEGDQDDESIMTETTMTGTIQGSPIPGDGEPRKKKKRKNKNKKNKNGQILGDIVSTIPAASNGMLFGESILD